MKLSDGLLLKPLLLDFELPLLLLRLSFFETWLHHLHGPALFLLLRFFSFKVDLSVDLFAISSFVWLCDFFALFLLKILLLVLPHVLPHRFFARPFAY